MGDLLTDTDFWKAIVVLGWPVAIIAIALLFRPAITGLMKRDTVSIKVAGMELNVAEAAEQAGKGLSDLQDRVAQLERAVLPVTAAGDLESLAAVDRPSGVRSILWVDDYPSNNAFIIEKLEDRNIRIRKELSTEAAMKALAQDRFGAVISDLGRREGGTDNPFAGLDLLRAMKAAAIPTPVLIFAGPRGEENRERLMEAGASGVTSSAVDVFGFVDRYLADPDH